ncbi:hypothetical protein T10_932 [Trichinella papuae]|uniref:Uncharacterized protein n=1 Tax=Trichinella papuae TaxID=268474 RepID=A0A0V1MRR1_9BILA|nr:hypothetical protein T10_932 [Trichinella papuae]
MINVVQCKAKITQTDLVISPVVRNENVESTVFITRYSTFLHAETADDKAEGFSFGIRSNF